MIKKKYAIIAGLFGALAFLVGFSGLITQLVVGKVLLFDAPVDGRYFAFKRGDYVEISALVWRVCKIQILAFMGCWMGGVISVSAGYLDYVLDYSRR